MLYLDTGTCIDCVQVPSTRDGWSRFYSNRPSGVAFRASPLTVTELMIKVSRGHDDYFSKNLEPLRFLWKLCFEIKHYLPYPGIFADKHLKGMSRDHPGFEPRDVRKWVQTAFFAKTRADLENEDGFRLPGRTGFVRYRLEMAKLEPEFLEGKQHHVVRLERARASKRRPPERDEWIRLWVDGNRKAHMPADLEPFVARLDAAYRFDRALYELARNDSYDFADHDTDYYDLQQLMYLCHDDFRFITTDKKLIGRIKDSSQRDRVMTVQDLAQRFSLA